MPRSVPVAPATRAFLAVAALGAGLLHAALAPGAPLPLLLVLGGVAGGELAWAVLALAQDRPPLFTLVPALALVPLGVWAALAIIGATASSGTVLELPLAPMGAASVLDLAVATTSAVILRRSRPPRAGSEALRFVCALAVSACAVCALTIPALGATDAGVAAVTVHHDHH
jgi:hypothetical protein